MGVESVQGSHALLMDQCDGDVHTLLIDEHMYIIMCKGNKPFHDAKSLLVIVRIAIGMEALHTHGITHRDLKTVNIVIKIKSKDTNGCS